MDDLYLCQLEYVSRRYDTINGVPVRDIPRRQLSAIYYRMKNGPKKKQDGVQLSFDDILKGETNGN